MIQWMLAIWSLVPLPFLNPAWTSGSSQLTYCWIGYSKKGLKMGLKGLKGLKMHISAFKMVCFRNTRTHKCVFIMSVERHRISLRYRKYWITQWTLNTMSWHHSQKPAPLDTCQQPVLPDPVNLHPMADIVKEEGECCWVLFPQNFIHTPLLLKQFWGHFK